MEGFAAPREWATALLSVPHLEWVVGGLGVMSAVALALHGWRAGPGATRKILAGRLVRLLQLAGVVAAILALCGLTYDLFHVLERDTRSVWVPRYLGVVWPAVALAVAALLMRLPTRPLRWAAVAFVLAVNLGQFGYRVLGDVEPRVDLITRDIWAAQDTGGPVRTYVRPIPANYGPSGGGISNFVGRYYLSLARGQHFTPWTMRFSRTESHARVWYVPTAQFVANDVKRSPNLRRLITWEPIHKDQADAPSRVLPLLGPGWELVRTDDYPVYLHWNWQYVQTLRRREYSRREDPIPAAREAPMTKPQ
jgi:hypothetical protein